MNIKRLRYFLAIAEHRHFGRAAQALHISQPPLSQQIGALEKEIGVKLFTRSTRHVDLTEAGRALCERITPALRQVDQAIAYAQLVHSGMAGPLRAGFVTTSADFLSGILLTFRNRYPEANIECHHMTSDEQASALHDGRIDVGLVRSLPPDPDISYKTISRDPLYVALPAQHPLSSMNTVPVSALADQPFVMWDRNHSAGLATRVKDLCREHGFTPKVAFEVVNAQALLSLVAGGLGIAVVPEPALRMRQAGLTYKRLRGKNTFAQLLLAWRRDNKRELLSHFNALIVDEPANARPQQTRRQAPVQPDVVAKTSGVRTPDLGQ